ncbi:MAG: 5-oxoprolinase subunit PxpB [Flavobacteriaceae bacterium]
MSKYPISLKLFGEKAILIEWPAEVSESILYDILAFAEHLRSDQLDASLWELVPAYNSLTLICSKKIKDTDQLIEQLKGWYNGVKSLVPVKRQLWKLPVCYDLEFGIDQETVASTLELSIDQIIEIHTKPVYTVYGIGFLPGFMYLGGLSDELKIPRKESPRLHVPKGSVGLAGQQTGIYPQESPGGWNIIGNCPIPIFSVGEDKPCFVSVGDRIKFYPITRAAYDLYKIETQVGIYKIEHSIVDV